MEIVCLDYQYEYIYIIVIIIIIRKKDELHMQKIKRCCYFLTE